MSVQITSWPASARHAAVTKPTYPQPITERCKRTLLSRNSQRGDNASTRLTIIAELWTERQMPGEMMPVKYRLQTWFAHQQAAETQEDELRAAANDVPEQARGFVAIDFP